MERSQQGGTQGKSYPFLSSTSEYVAVMRFSQESREQSRSTLRLAPSVSLSRVSISRDATCIALAKASGFAGGTSRPVRRSSTSSASPPINEAIRSVPQAIASIAAIEVASTTLFTGTDGTITARACAHIGINASLWTGPRNSICELTPNSRASLSNSHRNGPWPAIRRCRSASWVLARASIAKRTPFLGTSRRGTRNYWRGRLRVSFRLESRRISSTSTALKMTVTRFESTP